jgi:small subunit ribosomal protein S6
MAITSNYETLLILNLALGEEGINNLVEKFKKLISDNGEVSSVEEWGKRKLAYEINDETEGYYVLINFSCANDFPAELDRVYKITDGVLRSLIIKK